MSRAPDPNAAGEAEHDDDDILDLGSATVEGLARAGDAEGLFLLAKAARQGTHGRPKDLAVALAAYRTAGELGHGDADYAAALFSLTGTGGAERDFKDGTARLRRAAERGNLDAKVYLGNLYELGIHYAKDAEKADVWYRNAARAAGVNAAPGSPELVRALAQLGSVRHAELVAADPDVAAEEREIALKKARIRGGSLRDKLDAGSRESVPDALRTSATPPPVGDRTDSSNGRSRPSSSDSREAVGTTERVSTSEARASEPQRASKASDAEGPEALEQKRRERLAELSKKAKAPSKVTGKAGLGAFLYALLFSVTAFGAAFAAEAGARELVSHGKPLPLLGTRIELLFPIVLGLVSVFPQLLVYKLATVARSVLAAGAGFGVGWVLYGTGKLALGDARLTQAIAFAGAAFLASLLVQGLFGGSKGSSEPPPKVERPRR
jgi:hypothetical protein